MDLVIVESVLGGLVEEVAMDGELLDVDLLDIEEDVVEGDKLPDTDDGLPDVGLLVDVEKMPSVVDELVAAVE